MGIRNFLPKKGKEKFECHTGEDGKVQCRSFRQFEDGTRTETASMDFEFGSDCQGMATSMQENEPGALDKLEKKAYKRIQSKCKSAIKPSDY